MLPNQNWFIALDKFLRGFGGYRGEGWLGRP